MIPCLPHPIHSVQQSELDEAVCSPIDFLCLITYSLYKVVVFLQALYYLFAILGMELFSKAIVAPTTVTTDPSAGPEITGYGCGTYEQLQYWANNFDDFAVCPYNEL